LNIGGRALKDGVYFESDHYIVRSRYNNQGDIYIEEEQKSSVLTNSFVSFLESIPFIRGLMILFAMWWQAKKLFIGVVLGSFVLAILLTHFHIVTAENSTETLDHFRYVQIVLWLSLLLFIKRTYGKFHGAEHKAINAFMSNQSLEEASIQQQSRIADRCGTNFITIVVLLKALTWITAISFPLIDLVIWSIAYELFNLTSPSFRFLHEPFRLLGGWSQKYLTTSEPTLYEIKAAKAGITRLIELENKIISS